MTNYSVDDVLDMDNYSINQLDEYFIKNKVEIVIYGGESFVYGGNWSVKLEKVDDGIKLNIETKADTLYAAMYDAYEKFNQVAKRGAPNLLAPMIGSQVSPAARPSGIDDDITF